MVKRRQFITAAVGASAAIVFPKNLLSQQNEINQIKPIRAKRLKKGDTIGLIAPGYAIPLDVLSDTIKTLEKLGFKAYHTSRITGNYGYLSNTDKERVADLHEMFSNPEIDGILCARGGYGCTRIMSMIDFELIKKKPKVFIGFSDITALLNGIYIETGLITFHGPVGSTLDNSYTIKNLLTVIQDVKNEYTIENAQLTNSAYESDVEYERYTITEGVAIGKLVGGSLTLINALVGTKHELDFTDKLVCIEDVEEAPYRIDRMLTQLIEGPTFKKAAGIIFGVCAGCNSSTNPISFNLKEVILDRIRPLGIPAVYGMSFGHVKENFTFPIGIHARINTSKMTLQLLEKAVI